VEHLGGWGRAAGGLPPGLGRLPGDIAYRASRSVLFPHVTCILLSAVLNVVFWLVNGKELKQFELNLAPERKIWAWRRDARIASLAFCNSRICGVEGEVSNYQPRIGPSLFHYQGRQAQVSAFAFRTQASA